MQTAAATTEQVVSIYIYMIYMVVSVYWLLCMVCVFVCVCVCVIPNQSIIKKLHYGPNISNLDALLHETQRGPFGTEIRRFDIHMEP